MRRSYLVFMTLILLSAFVLPSPQSSVSAQDPCSGLVPSVCRRDRQRASCSTVTASATSCVTDRAKNKAAATWSAHWLREPFYPARRTDLPGWTGLVVCRIAGRLNRLDRRRRHFCLLP